MPNLRYLGHAGFTVEGSQSTLVIDPFLTGNPLAAAKPADIKCDFIILSHGHPDHVGDTIEIAKANNATVIAAYELANFCQAQGATVHPMSIGGGFNFPFGRVKMTIAHHASSSGDGAYMGQPAGLLITMGGKTLYHAGDTGLFLDMKLIGELNNIDLAILPIGDNFTMGIDDAVRAMEFLNAKKAIPMHYNTFDIIQADPAEFVAKLSQKSMLGQVMAVGETISY